jgi:hypothetical protein
MSDDNKGAAYLQSALSGMVTATPKQAWRFDSEIPNLLLPTIQKTRSVLDFSFILCFLELLLFGSTQRFLLGFFCLEVLKNGAKVA